MMLIVKLLLALSCLTVNVLANTEKVIFLGPPDTTGTGNANSPTGKKLLTGFDIISLWPHELSVRTELEAQFPSNTSKHGKSSWIFLGGLTPGRRYEVRVCWAATQPTTFRMNTYELNEILEDTKLLADLSAYSLSRSQRPTGRKDETAKLATEAADSANGSAILLRIQAAADYFTTDVALMANVPPVKVDIIVDPYVMNVLPQSLQPTVVYIIFIAIGSWFLAQRISTWIQGIAAEEPSQERKRQ